MKHGNMKNHDARSNQKGEAYPCEQPSVMGEQNPDHMNSNDEIGTGPAVATIIGSGTSTGVKETQPGTHAYG